jgi:hypothetical protein
VKLLIVAITLAMAACARSPYPNPTCDKFASRDAAQDFYEAHIEHGITLDPDGNGVACDHPTTR